LGQKTNPIGLRLGISRSWDSNWFARGRDFARFIEEDERIRRYVYRRLERAQLSRIIIERKPQEVNVIISTARPGLVIGSRGSTIDSLTSELKHLTKKTVKIKVNQVEKPETDVSVRRAMKRTISDSMRAGAEGIKITCSGRLGGAEMSRVNSYHEGRVPLHTLRANIDFARGVARTTYGVIGVKVWIYTGEVHEVPVAGS